MHRELKHWPQALEAYDRVIKSNMLSKRRLSWAYVQRGVVHDRLGKIPEAIEDYTMSAKLDPNLGRAYIYRANDFAARGDTKRALADFAYVVDHIEHMRPDVRDAGFDSVRKDVYHFRALLYKRMGRPDLEKADLRAELRQQRDDLELPQRPFKPGEYNEIP